MEQCPNQSSDPSWKNITDTPSCFCISFYSIISAVLQGRKKQKKLRALGAHILPPIFIFTNEDGGGYQRRKRDVQIRVSTFPSTPGTGTTPAPANSQLAPAGTGQQPKWHRPIAFNVMWYLKHILRHRCATERMTLLCSTPPVINV